ncbi:S-layer homology domain-containing protein [Cohnella rhizosphaerae]|uniref:S-layer homology domain-containing protein n=1 Tax=Cohnella rhizosphaerae TaxID=1457232 RepID=UPI003B8A664B
MSSRRTISRGSGLLSRKKSFADLERHAWARDSIEALASKGIVGGVGGQAFEPGRGVTRAEFAVMLVEALGLAGDTPSSFTDVKPGDYFYRAAGALRQNGISNGAGDGRFLPNAVISRQEMMTMAARALRSQGMLEAPEAGSPPEFEDFGQISAYAREGIARLAAAGLIQGNEGRIRPVEHATRAEAAVFLYRIYLYAGEAAE